MTDQPETRSFGSVLNDLELTPAEAAQLLSRWAADLRDSIPGLHSRLTEHAASLSAPVEEVPVQETEKTDTTFVDAAPAHVEETTGEVTPAPMEENRPAEEQPHPNA